MTAENQVERRFERFADFVEEYSARLSLGGMFLETDEMLPVGTPLTIEFHLSDDFRLFRAESEVLWVRPTDEHGPRGIGVRFRKLDEAGRNLVLKVLEEHVKGGGEPFDVEELLPGARIATLDARGADAAPSSGSEPGAAPEAAGGGGEAGDDFGAPWGHELPDLPNEILDESGGSARAASALEFEGDVPPLASLEAVDAPDDGQEESDGPVPAAAQEEDEAVFADGPDWSELETGSEVPPPDDDPGFEEVDWGTADQETVTFDLGERADEGEEAALPPTVSFELDQEMLGPLDDDGSEPGGEAGADIGSSGGSADDDEEDALPDETFDAAEEMTGFRMPDEPPGGEAPDDPFDERDESGPGSGVGSAAGAVGSPDLDASLLSNVDDAFRDEGPPPGTGSGTDDGTGEPPDIFGVRDPRTSAEASPPPTPAERPRSVSPAEAALSSPTPAPSPYDQLAWSSAESSGGLTRLFDTIQERWLPVTLVLLVVAAAAWGWLERERLLTMFGAGDDAPVVAGEPEDRTPPEPVAPAGTAEVAEGGIEDPPVTRIGPDGVEEEASVSAEALAASAPPPSTAPPPSSAAATGGGSSARAVSEISARTESGSTRVSVVLDGGISDGRIRSYRLSGGTPRQLVILRGIEEPFRQGTVTVDTPELRRVRTGFHEKADGPELHVVLDLASSAVEVELVRIGRDRLELLLTGVR